MTQSNAMASSARGTMRWTMAAALSLPAFALLPADAIAQTPKPPELFQLCSSATHVGIPDAPSAAANGNRVMIYHACIATGGLAALSSPHQRA